MLWAAFTRPFLNTSLSFDLSPKFCAPPVTLIKSLGFCNFQQLNSTWVIRFMLGSILSVFWPTRINFYFFRNETDIIIITYGPIFLKMSGTFETVSLLLLKRIVPKASVSESSIVHVIGSHLGFSWLFVLISCSSFNRPHPQLK